MVDGAPQRDAETPRVTVEPLAGSGIRLDDRIDRRTVTVRTDRDVTPEPVPGDRFRYPLDTAVALTASHLELVPIGACFLHGPASSTEIETLNREVRDEGTYVIEISGPVKVYAEVTGPCTIEHEGDELTVDLERPDTVVIGARSFHERPATTVTTTEDPVDVMAAVSTFGSELKSVSCRRSYPTRRGHPPAVEVGEERSIPAEVEPRAGSVHLEVPRGLGYVLAVAPLAYYLGAPVEPATCPSLVVDGDAYRLDSADGFEATVDRTLKRTFFMDCLVRTATTRDVMLHERERLDGVLDVDVDRLVGRPPHERLAAYMGIPYETIEPQLPDWRTAAHVHTTPAGIESLPFLANDLASIRVPDRASNETGSIPDTGETTGGPDDRCDAPGTESDTSVTDAASTREVVRPPETDAVGETWVGPGVPVGASKAVPAAFHNRLDRERRGEGAVEVAVVCTDEEMVEEGDDARAVYGSNQRLPFDVSVHHAADTAALGDLLESDLDYVHYVGHVGDGGFECADGTLDVGSIDGVGVDIAFLNACRSYEQGLKLVEQGAIASVVTVGEVLDAGAFRIGTLMARLLNQGFAIDRALSIARVRSIVGSEYLVVGDPDADIAQAQSLIPSVVRVESVAEDAYRVRLTPAPTKSSGMGAQFHPSIGDDPSVYLAPKTLPPVDVSTERLREYLGSGSMPVIMDGEVTWSEDVIDRL